MKKYTLKTISKSLIIAGVLCAVSLPSMAQNHRNSNYKNSNYKNYDHKSSAKKGHATYDYAKVVNVNPVYETVQINHPVEHCYDQRVPVKQNHSRRNASYTNEIIGGVIGAAVGNRVGKNGGGKARDVATLVGAVLGASVARDVERTNSRHSSNNGHYQETRYKTVQHCELQDSYSTQREIVGYDVAYNYHGNIYHTYANNHPGKKIKVKVTVNPV